MEILNIQNDEHQSGAFLLKEEFNVVIPRDGEWRQSEADGIELYSAVGDFGGEEECFMAFNVALRPALGGQFVLSDDWMATAKVISWTGRRALGVSSGRKADDV